jgi:mRNA interferase RelE/StbE
LDPIIYTIELSRRAERQLRAFPREVQARIGRSVDALSRQPVPPGARKFSGHDDLYRIRAGDYRIVYTVRHEVLVVLVVAVGHRREIYNRLP